MAEIERQEILRREDALSRINHKIDEMRKKHRTIESVFENQVPPMYNNISFITN